MSRYRPAVLSVALLAIVGTSSIACKSRTYEDQRPPVDQLDARDRGLQSKDVVDASQTAAMDLLALPELNADSRAWTVVFTGVRNQTSTAPQNLDIFTQRLRTIVGQQGRGRVRLIQNREQYREMQSRELEQSAEREDEFGQGGRSGRTRTAPGAAGTQPDFLLEATARDLPNRGTNYYNIEFTLTDLNNREIVWNHGYEVRVAR